MLTKIEMQALDAVIGIQREMKKANEPDWEQHRYEIAKEMTAVIWLDDGFAERANEARGGLQFENKTTDQIAREAVQMADALIAELKKGSEP